MAELGYGSDAPNEVNLVIEISRGSVNKYEMDKDTGEKDEKLICVPAKDVTKDHVKSVEDLGANFKPMIEHFYTHYKDWKNGWKGVDVHFNGWGGRERGVCGK